jgi:putative DNA primase/helicase
VLESVWFFILRLSVKVFPRRKKSLLDHARRSSCPNRIKAMPEVASYREKLIIPCDAFDADPYLFNCANEAIDLRNGELQSHNRADLLSKISPVAYDADAQWPAWDAFLSQIMGNNQDMIDFLQRTIGYPLTALTSEQCFHLLWKWRKWQDHASWCDQSYVWGLFRPYERKFTA